MNNKSFYVKDIENKDQIFHDYLTITDEYLLKKCGKEIQTSNGVYYSSDVHSSTRQIVLNSLKKDQYKVIVDLKYRMKLTDTELRFILFEE